MKRLLKLFLAFFVVEKTIENTIKTLTPEVELTNVFVNHMNELCISNANVTIIDCYPTHSITNKEGFLTFGVIWTEAEFSYRQNSRSMDRRLQSKYNLFQNEEYDDKLHSSLYLMSVYLTLKK